MKYSAIFVQALLATVMAAPISVFDEENGVSNEGVGINKDGSVVFREKHDGKSVEHILSHAVAQDNVSPCFPGNGNYFTYPEPGPCGQQIPHPEATPNGTQPENITPQEVAPCISPFVPAYHQPIPPFYPPQGIGAPFYHGQVPFGFPSYGYPQPVVFPAPPCDYHPPYPTSTVEPQATVTAVSSTTSSVAAIETSSPCACEQVTTSCVAATVTSWPCVHETPSAIPVISEPVSCGCPHEEQPHYCEPQYEPQFEPHYYQPQYEQPQYASPQYQDSWELQTAHCGHSYAPALPHEAYSQPQVRPVQHYSAGQDCNTCDNEGCYAKSGNNLAVHGGQALRYLFCPWSLLGKNGCCANGLCKGGCCGSEPHCQEPQQHCQEPVVAPCYQPPPPPPMMACPPPRPVCPPPPAPPPAPVCAPPPPPPKPVCAPPKPVYVPPPPPPKPVCAPPKPVYAPPPPPPKPVCAPPPPPPPPPKPVCAPPKPVYVPPPPPPAPVCAPPPQAPCQPEPCHAKPHYVPHYEPHYEPVYEHRYEPVCEPCYQSHEPSHEMECCMGGSDGCCYDKAGSAVAGESGRCFRWLFCPWSWFGDRFDNGVHAQMNQPQTGCCAGGCPCGY